MHQDFDIWAFMAGLPLGLVIAGIVYYFVWKKGKKERLFDERYKNIHRHARSISWKVMTVAILIAWIIVMIVEGAKLAFFIMTALWVIHMLSWAIGAAIASKNH
jgi:TRAP-type C4-dicarboxylate transport system permease large subunit